ncbi:RNA binding protein fox-1 homolog 1-like isoform X2 [Haliotis rubra]|uniref:RNA binding protein fox-1 homolog 1-like isoform X2 n=1 Tax=Haliotis rubra TaxID=36100 RepID=UPI001EE59C78|nr:RNA binding protein fox-1 homolog 1-like isoform X2 [Haliotis rubra]
MAETITQVSGNGPAGKIDEKLMKLFTRDPAKDFLLQKENSGTQTMLHINGTKEINEENKENRTNGEHMVQNQMTPTYTYPQTGVPGVTGITGVPTVPGVPGVTSLEDYHHQVVASQATSVASEQPPTTVYASPAAVTPNGAIEQQTVRAARPFNQTDLPVEGDIQPSSPQPQGSQGPNSGPKRLHVSNIPFRFREADLRQLLGVEQQFGPILDVEIIFNERGSKGFGFVTFANSSDADRAREKLNGTVVEGRKIEVNNATARVMTKKAAAPTIPNAAALRGVALTRGRAAAAGLAARGAYTAAAAAAAAAFRHPTPLAATATALPYAAGVYQDPFLATYDAATARYQLVTTQPYAAAAGYPGAATRYAIPAVATAATYPAGYGREYAADPYLGHGIGPVTGYGVTEMGVPLSLTSDIFAQREATVYRGGYQRFAPY